MALRRKIERPAVLRRALPPGGELKGPKSNPQYFQLCRGKTSSDKSSAIPRGYGAHAARLGDRASSGFGSTERGKIDAQVLPSS
jgi:hypothetical protein